MFALYVMRHGIAEDFDPARMRSDADRRLTDEGRVKLEAQAKGLGKLDLDIGLCLASPFVRARETAEIVARALNRKLSIEVANELVPHADTSAILDALAARQASVPTLLFGHEPHLSTLVAHVLGDRGTLIEMKKGTLCGLELGRLAPPFRGQLRCLLPPRAQRAMG